MRRLAVDTPHSLGHMNKRNGNDDVAKDYFLKTVAFTKAIGNLETGYYLYAQLYLAQYEKALEQNNSALERIEIIRDNTKRKDMLNKQAKALRKEIRKKR